MHCTDNYRNPFIRRKVLLAVAMSKLMSCNPEGGEMTEQLVNLHPAWHSQSAGADLIAGLRLDGIRDQDWKKRLVHAWKDRSRTSQTLGLKACQNISSPAASQKKHEVFSLCLKGTVHSKVTITCRWKVRWNENDKENKRIQTAHLTSRNLN